jgi:hypothetical protein
MPREKNITMTPLTQNELIKLNKQMDANMEKNIQFEKEWEQKVHAKFRQEIGEEAYQLYLKEEAELEKEAELDLEKRCRMDQTAREKKTI